MKIITKIIYLLYFFILTHSSALGQLTNSGTDFWFGFPAVCDYTTDTYTIYMSSLVNTSGTITVPGQGFSQTFTITPGVMTSVVLPSSAVALNSSEVIENKAIHITSLDNIVVYGFTEYSVRNDASVIYPVASLGSDYYVMSYNLNNTSEFLIVAPGVPITVEITPSAVTNGGHPAGLPFIVTINANEEYEVQSNSSDLIGSRVRAVNQTDKFAVMGGSRCSSVTCSGTVDPAYEQLIPTNTWGSEYIFYPTPNHTTDLCRILAAETCNGSTTQITIDGNVVANLYAGEHYDQNISAPAYISANGPISVARWLKTGACNGNSSNEGDPAMLIVGANEQMKLTNITFGTSASSNMTSSYVQVVTHTADANSILLNGSNISSNFSTVTGNTAFSVATVQVTGGASYNLTTSGAGFLAYITQLGNITSITYSAGAVLDPLAPYIILDTFSVCLHQSIHFSDSVAGNPQNIVGRLWDFGDGSPTDTSQHPTHLYAAVGTFSVTLSLITSGGICITTTKDIFVRPLPNAGFSAADVCFGDTTLFNDTSTIASGDTLQHWVWNFGDSTALNTGQNPTHHFANFGSFPVKLIVTTNNGCSDSVTQNAIVHPLPEVAFSATTVCLGDTTLFSDSSIIQTTDTLQSWLWDFGDTSMVSTIQNATHVYQTDGTYTVLVKVNSAFGCIDSAQHSVIVHPRPVADFSNTTVCSDSVTQFTDLSSTTSGIINSWLWNFHDLSPVDTSQNPIHVYTNPGFDTATVIVLNSFGCADTVIKPVQVYYNPKVGFTHIDVCLGDSLYFTDTSIVDTSASFVSYLWSFGENSFTSSSQNPGHLYSQFGTYTVVLTATTNNGCTDTAQANVIVHPLPVPDFVASGVCQGTATQLYDASSIPATDTLQSWLWNFDDAGSGDTSQNTSHVYPSSGSYNAVLIVESAFGCADSIVKLLVVNPNPNVSFVASDTIGCSPLCLSFQNTSSIVSGNNVSSVWDFGDGSPVSTQQDIFHCYANDSVFTILNYTPTLTVTSDSGCISVLSKNNYVSVFPNPIANFIITPQNTTIVNPLISINNLTSGANYWNWSFGDTTTTFIENPPDHNYNDTGSYQIVLIASNQYSCRDTAYETVTIAPDFLFFIPNAFSPNGDGINDTFIGKGIFINTYEMSIFDRWGNLIFHSDDLSESWDGKANHGSDLAQQDVYVYLVVVSDFNNRKYRYRGTVTLVR